MRITSNTQYRDGVAGLEGSAERLLRFQRQVASGRRIEKPSDDPPGAANALAERSQIASIEQYSRMAGSVGSRLTIVDTVLGDVVEKITLARSTAMGARGSTKTDAQRQAASQQLAGIRDALRDNFNVSFQGMYIFSGAASMTKPYETGPGNVVTPYAGSATEIKVEIGDGRTVAIGIYGEAIARGSDTEDVFAVINGLIQAVEAGDDHAIGEGMARLDAAFQRATAAQSRIGGDMQAIDAEVLRLQQMKLAATGRLSRIEDVNMAEAISNMQQADAAYRAALASVSTASKVSLLDYLR